VSILSEFRTSVLDQVTFMRDFLDKYWKDLRDVIPEANRADLDLLYNKLSEARGAALRLKEAKEAPAAVPTQQSPGSKIDEQRKIHEPGYQSGLVLYRQELKNKNYPEYYAEDKRKVESLMQRHKNNEESLLAEVRRTAAAMKIPWKAFLRGNAARALGREDLACIFFIRGIDLAKASGTVDW
jgi:hypothetical protein